MFPLSSDGSRYSGASDGMFRKPSEGQSLISYLSEQDFGSCADLEKVVVVSSSFFLFKKNAYPRLKAGTFIRDQLPVISS